MVMTVEQESQNYMLNMPIAGKMTKSQIASYRQLLALQLRASNMSYIDISKVLNLQTSKAAKCCTVKGYKTFQDCILNTITL